MARNSYDMDDNMKSSESETYDKTKNQSRHIYAAILHFIVNPLIVSID